MDDEEYALDGLEMALCSHGLDNTVACSDPRKVAGILKKHDVSVMVLDLMMPGMSGEEVMDQARKDRPDVPVIVVTAVNDVQRAVECMKRGAFDYILKPVDGERFVTAVRHALEVAELRLENVSLKTQLLSPSDVKHDAFREITTRNSEMLSMLKYVEAIATTSQPVLVTGETGVGKELVVRGIHRLSERSGELVPVNVAGLDDSVFSDTIFGHEKGAFTGASEKREGLVVTAANGTLFLDEIGDLSHASQVKLLRLLQEREYMALGNNEVRKSSARIVVATHCELQRLQESGRFRRDLYYRLSAHHVDVPPLRKRMGDDLGVLLDSLLSAAAEKLEKKKPSFPPELLPLLRTYDFPGNVRELELMILDALSRPGSGMLSLDRFKEHINRHRKSIKADSRSEQETHGNIIFPRPLPTIKETTRLLVDEAMSLADNNQSLAAQMLGISVQALNQRLKRRSRQT